MKKSKQILALPILLMSCALSLSACFGGGELDPNGGSVDNGGETNTEGMTDAELLENLSMLSSFVLVNMK